MIGELGPQRPDIDPRAGRELEILGKAPLETSLSPDRRDRRIEKSPRR